ncbi:MAG: triose-phosphate isomerase [Cytophagia bacterium]|nr:triose-phosphate isomerase [Cytophagia bacterium]
MSKRRPLILGNWKMNTLPEEGRLVARQMVPMIRDGLHWDMDWGLAIPYTHLGALRSELEGSGMMGAQDCSAHLQGAYTGEISAGILAAMHCSFALVGHSERRLHHHESSATCGLKIDRLRDHGLMSVYCVGETLEQRQGGSFNEVITTQLKEALGSRIQDLNHGSLAIAYEPVWAIGTGLNASPEQAQEIHAYIRKLLANQYNEEIASTTSILYGGSVKPENAAALFMQADIDGGLIGGASLKARDFIDIVKAMR